MKPFVICHMMSSIDGRLHPSRYTKSPDGGRADWTKLYEGIHDQLEGDAWLVGRVTMAEMAPTSNVSATETAPAERPVHVARRAAQYAIGFDRSGKLHFDGGDIGGDHVVVLLGRDVPDAHLAELTARGVSYIVAEDAEMDPAALLERLAESFGVRRLLLEGGGTINGSLMAAGLVDELSLVLVPAVDGGIDAQGVIGYGAHGLGGKVSLSLISAATLDHGAVHLRYRIAS